MPPSNEGSYDLQLLKLFGQITLPESAQNLAYRRPASCGVPKFSSPPATCRFAGGTELTYPTRIAPRSDE